jgi:glycerol kinase
MLDLKVERPHFIETTALGAAMLAGMGCGLFGSLEEAAAMRGKVESFDPHMDAAQREQRLSGWREAVRTVLRQ